jgi:hypothetical protein
MAGGMSFREAVESKRYDALEQVLAEDVAFYPPGHPEPARAGIEGTVRVLEVALGIFEELRYTDELSGDGVQALFAEGKLDGAAFNLVDFLRFDEEGRVSELYILIRPSTVAEAMPEKIRARMAETGGQPG